VEDGIERFFAETRIEVPSRLALAVLGIRPQPGSGDLLLAISIPESAPVSAEFLDVTGRRVVERRWAALEPGNQLLRLTDLGLPSGMYLVRIVQSGRSASAKAVIVN
jgi:hypothetical protein